MTIVRVAIVISLSNKIVMSDLEDSRASSDSSSEDDVIIPPLTKCVTKSMSVNEVCSYLKGKGIPKLYCDVFKG